jgi:isopenicillin-N N-acyltransferase-like protein
MGINKHRGFLEEDMPSKKGERKIKVVEVSGSSYEMGFQYGAACPEIRKALDINYQIFGGQSAFKKLAEKYIPVYLPFAQEYAPEIVDEMKGMAAGVKLDFQDIFFLNITYEISGAFVMGCTSFAASGAATGTGEVIAGQNFDYLNLWEEIMVLLKMKPTHGPRILAVAPPGGLGLIGLNSAGISLNLNLLRNRDSLKPQGEVPSHMILRKVLTSETIGEAIGTIASARRRSAKNYLLASEQGDIADVEVTLDDVDVQFAGRGILTHANCFKADRFKSADLAPAYLPDSYIRSQRLFQIMENHHGRLSVEVMKQLLQDHNNYPNSICRHPNPKSPLPMGRMMKTLVSLISCPKERKAYIALGGPCENEYIEYQL